MGKTRVMNKRVGGRMMQLHTLDTIMEELGHAWLDVLKVDIEGFEWGVLETLVGQDEPLPFTQLQVRAHNPHTHAQYALWVHYCTVHAAGALWSSNYQYARRTSHVGRLLCEAPAHAFLCHRQLRQGQTECRAPCRMAEGL